MSPTPAAAPARVLDTRAVRHVLDRLAARPEPPWLHAEVARRMAQRLPVIRRVPDTVLQWWSWLGASDAALRALYPKARQLHIEPTPALCRRSLPATARPWWALRRRRATPPDVLPDDGELPRGELLWANMMLHAVADPPALMARWRQAIAVDGFLMFSSLGPDTLAGLRALYADAGWGSPGAPFVDMHDLGDMLVHAGFADPVMDQESIVLSWATPEAALAELRGLGGNADPQRIAGWRTPRWRARLLDALRARAGADGRIALRFEVVYGHAFNPPPRARVAAHTTVALDDLRTMARAGRKPRT